MIAVENLNGELIKVFQNNERLDFGLHRLFGFIGENSAHKRLEQRKLKGHEFNANEWVCKLSIDLNGQNITIKDSENCELNQINDSSWQLLTENGEFRISNRSVAEIINPTLENEDHNPWLEKWTLRVILLMFAALTLMYFMQDEVEQLPVEVKKKEQITVKVVKPVNTVKLNRVSSSTKVKPLTKAAKAKRAVKRNLGFLGMVGSKNLKKVTGGVPQKLKAATAGAGKGGNAGSGGEVLTGLGKGLKKTTVGNTGVAGLGGVGTKGAGGGQGGYGSTMVASGSGSGISAINVASNDLVLDGGLSRYAINATIAKYLSQVRRCYEAQLNKYPDIEGLVTVAFEIGGNGMLNYSRVKKSSLGNKNVEKCITTKMMKWKFPKPKGGVNVKVSYPFMLRPVGT